MMKVARRMQREIYTVQRNAPIENAQTLMSAHNIRHLPVLDGNRLVGMLSERDIRAMLIPHSSTSKKGRDASFYLPGDVAVEDAMTRDPIFVEPGSEIEDAARLLLENKIGGLPVVENDTVVGIITETDILYVFCEMMGFLEASTRLDIVVDSEPEGLEKISEIIGRHGGRIISVAMLPGEMEGKKVHSFRLGQCDTTPIVAELRTAGFAVADES
jgi:acetoin utilization protein AcuB